MDIQHVQMLPPRIHNDEIVIFETPLTTLRTFRISMGKSSQHPSTNPFDRVECCRPSLSGRCPLSRPPNPGWSQILPDPPVVLTKLFSFLPLGWPFTSLNRLQALDFFPAMDRSPLNQVFPCSSFKDNPKKTK